jgi:F-type H+-transporting ATPase subunit epsilon
VADTLKLTILSPERRLLNKQAVVSVVLPGSEGEIQILPGHQAMIGTIQAGAFWYDGGSGAKGEHGVISSGFFEIKEDHVTVTAETLELRGEIDVARAKQAQQKAETALQDANLDEHQFKKYQLKLQRALVRQQFASKETQASE